MVQKNATHDVSVQTEKPGHYIVKNTGKESILLIKIFVNADANVTKWYVKTKNPRYDEPHQCQFPQISLIPSPQRIVANNKEVIETTHGSIRRSEGHFVNLTCVIEPDKGHNKEVRWEFSKDEHTFTKLPHGVSQEGNSIQIEHVKKSHRGYYRCKLNDVSFIVLLRVKDKLAELWPFLGIVTVVLVLVTIILIFEKRQKSNKKSATTDEDEHDHASDPLVRTTTRSSDNDTKKRAVRA